MKKAELIKLLEQVPDDAEIVVNGYNDDILGEYTYNPNLQFYEDRAYLCGSSIQQKISNYRFATDKEEKEIKVWVLE